MLKDTLRWRQNLFTVIKKKIDLEEGDYTKLIDSTIKWLDDMERHRKIDKSVLVKLVKEDSYKVTPIFVSYLAAVQELDVVITSELTTDQKDSMICDILRVVAQNTV